MIRTDTWMEFNGHDFDGYLIAEDVTRSLLPGISNRYVKGYHLDDEIQPTVITVRVRLIQNSNHELTELKRTIAGMLYTNEPKKLLLYDDPNRYDLAKIDGSTDYSKLWTTGSAELKFINYSGLSISNQVKSIPINTSSEIMVGGTWETKPVIKVIFNSTANSYKITNLTTGEYVEIAGQSFAGGNQLIIDCDNELVTLNGNNIMKKVTIQSDFFALKPGKNVITSTRAGTIEFNEVWL